MTRANCTYTYNKVYSNNIYMYTTQCDIRNGNNNNRQVHVHFIQDNCSRLLLLKHKMLSSVNTQVTDLQNTINMSVYINILQCLVRNNHRYPNNMYPEVLSTGDEVFMRYQLLPAYTYTGLCSVTCHLCAMVSPYLDGAFFSFLMDIFFRDKFCFT